MAAFTRCECGQYVQHGTKCGHGTKLQLSIRIEAGAFVEELATLTAALQSLVRADAERRRLALRTIEKLLEGPAESFLVCINEGGAVWLRPGPELSRAVASVRHLVATMPAKVDDRAATVARIVDRLEQLGPDELRVVERIAERLAMGRKQYGPLDLATDRRDMRKEASEEALDAAVYLAADLLRSPQAVVGPSLCAACVSSAQYQVTVGHRTFARCRTCAADAMKDGSVMLVVEIGVTGRHPLGTNGGCSYRADGCLRSADYSVVYRDWNNADDKRVAWMCKTCAPTVVRYGKAIRVESIAIAGGRT